MMLFQTILFYLILNREQLKSNASKGQFFLRVDLDDLGNFDEKITEMIREYPADYMPVV